MVDIHVQYVGQYSTINSTLQPAKVFAMSVVVVN